MSYNFRIQTQIFECLITSLFKLKVKKFLPLYKSLPSLSCLGLVIY